MTKDEKAKMQTISQRMKSAMKDDIDIITDGLFMDALKDGHFIMTPETVRRILLIGIALYIEKGTLILKSPIKIKEF